MAVRRCGHRMFMGLAADVAGFVTAGKLARSGPGAQFIVTDAAAGAISTYTVVATTPTTGAPAVVLSAPDTAARHA